MQPDGRSEFCERQKRQPSGSSPLAELVHRPLDRVGEILDNEKLEFARFLSEAAPDIASIVGDVAEKFFQRIEAEVRAKDFRGALHFESAVRGSILRSGEQLYRSVGKDVLGPLVVRFAEHVLSRAPHGATVAFLARDAEPYFEAAKILCDHAEFAQKNLHLRYVTLNRQHFQIFDENLKKEQRRDADEHQEQLKNLYLNQEGFDNSNGVVIVDTGCWGTLIEKLWAAKAQQQKMARNLTAAFFMYSHNPNIYGFVNDVALKTPKLEELATSGVVICDTFECLPKSYESSSRFTCNARGVVSPELISIQSPSLAAWHQSVLAGIRSAASAFLGSPQTFPTPAGALMIMEDGRKRAGAEFTGVLPQATPKWSGGDQFLEHWQLTSIPPLREA